MKFKEISKMSKKDIEKKLKDLKLELIKSKANATKGGSGKAKQIRRIIARINTLNKTENKPEVGKK